MEFQVFGLCVFYDVYFVLILSCIGLAERKKIDVKESF